MLKDLSMVQASKTQGSKGIRQLPTNWWTSPHVDTQNYPFYRLHLVDEKFGQSTFQPNN